MTDAAVTAALVAVRDDVLKDRSWWRRHNWATTWRGWPVSPFATEARRFCIEGATVRACGYDTDLRNRTLDHLNRVAGGRIDRINDDPATRFTDVRALLDRAIALSRGEGESR